MDFASSWADQLDKKASDAGMSTRWKLVALVILVFMLITTTVSILKLGYQFTLLVIKLGAAVTFAVVEITLISILLYPLKGCNIVIRALATTVFNHLVKFLEHRLTHSTLIKGMNDMWEVVVKENPAAPPYRPTMLIDDVISEEGHVHIY